MDLITFERDRDFVLDAVRQGNLDYLEPVTEAAEGEFFRHILGRRIMERLVETYPTPREKEEVPVWLYIASQMSLRLHGTGSYHSFPYVIRSGGLISALGPTVGRKVVHPDTGDVSLACVGFNDKNTNDRQTPCDQDFLRKFGRDTDSGRLTGWYNQEVPLALRGSKLLDPEGIYIGDASYVFVPDNERYEGSVKLLFDEHNHPVDSEEVDLKDKRYQWRRCYKLVNLIHVNRAADFFFVVGARLVSGNVHESPVLYEMVEEFVKAVGRGWMCILILDRGFIDGEAIGRLKQIHHIDTVMPLRKNMDTFIDVQGLAGMKEFAWETYPRLVATRRDQTDRPKHPTIIKREAKRQQTLAARKGLPPPPPMVPAVARIGIVRDLRSWSSCPVPLTAVISRETDVYGQVNDWVIITTAQKWSAAEIRSTYEIRPTIEERHRQYKCFWDLMKVTSRAFSLVLTHVLFVLLTYTLVQVFLLRQRKELTRGTRVNFLRRLGPTIDVVALYYQQKFCLISLPEFAEILLLLPDGEPRRKLLKKVKSLKREIYSLLANPRPP